MDFTDFVAFYDTDFYIAIGVLSGVLFITILVVVILFAYVLSIRKQLKQQRPQGAFDKYEEYNKGRAQIRNEVDHSQLPIPNMYGEEPVVQSRGGSRNPLAHQQNNNNFERNAAVINEIRRELKQTNYQQAPTPPLKPEPPSWPTTPTHQLLRQPSHVHNMESKNFFY